MFVSQSFCSFTSGLWALLDWAVAKPRPLPKKNKKKSDLQLDILSSDFLFLVWFLAFYKKVSTTKKTLSFHVDQCLT